VVGQPDVLPGGPGNTSGNTTLPGGQGGSAVVLLEACGCLYEGGPVGKWRWVAG